MSQTSIKNLKPQKKALRGKKPATGSAPVDSPTRRRLPVLLRRCWFNLNQAFRRRITHTGITPDQFTVMRNLLEGDSLGMTQRALTEVMSSDANTIASLLERMESSGLVERQHHEKDRRAYRIRVTSEGKKKHSEIRKIAVQLQTEILKVLPESQRDRFLESLESVSEACRNVANKNNGEQK